MSTHLSWLLLANGLAHGLVGMGSLFAVIEGKSKPSFYPIGYLALTILNLVAAGAVWP